MANHESFRFWQHLSLTNMWPGKFTGINGSSGNGEVVFAGTSPNSPLSRLPGGKIGWMLFDGTTPWGVYSSIRNTLSLGMAVGGDNGNWGGGISPANAKWIDTKIDDGLSFSTNGSIFSGGVGAGQCVADIGSGSYNVTDNNPVCTMIFRLHQ